MSDQLTTTATVLEVNCITGEQTYREHTAEELAMQEAYMSDIAAKRAADEQAQATQAASLASAQAKLTSLGLTAEEVAAITGQPVTTPTS